MGMGFAPTWLRQVSPPPLLHKTTLSAVYMYNSQARVEPAFSADVSRID